MASPAVLYHWDKLLLSLFTATWFTFAPSKISAGSAASGTAASEATEASAATTVIVASPASPETASSAAHQISQEKEDQARIAGLDKKEED